MKRGSVLLSILSYVGLTLLVGTVSVFWVVSKTNNYIHVRINGVDDPGCPLDCDNNGLCKFQDRRAQKDPHCECDGL